MAPKERGTSTSEKKANRWRRKAGLCDTKEENNADREEGAASNPTNKGLEKNPKERGDVD